MTKGWEFLHKWCALDDDHEVRIQVRHSNLHVLMLKEVGGQRWQLGFALSEMLMREAQTDVLLNCAQHTAKQLMDTA